MMKPDDVSMLFEQFSSKKIFMGIFTYVKAICHFGKNLVSFKEFYLNESFSHGI